MFLTFHEELPEYLERFLKYLINASRRDIEFGSLPLLDLNGNDSKCPFPAVLTDFGLGAPFFRAWICNANQDWIESDRERSFRPLPIEVGLHFFPLPLANHRNRE